MFKEEADTTLRRSEERVKKKNPNNRVNGTTGEYCSGWVYYLFDVVVETTAAR